MNTSRQRKISTISHDFSPLCSFWTRLINPIPPNTLHPSRAYAHEPQRSSYLGLIFASSIIFLKSSLACIILFFFSLRSSSARVFTYWSNTYRNTSHPQQTHNWHTEALGMREEKSHFFPSLLFPFLSPQNQHRGGRNLKRHFVFQYGNDPSCCTCRALYLTHHLRPGKKFLTHSS